MAIHVLVICIITLLHACSAPMVQAQTNAQPKPKEVRIGAVAYSPSAVTIFEGIKKYLNKNGFPSDYVLYSNYDALVGALQRREVDIAWNTPLAHARYHAACGQSQTLVMRDVDKGIRSVLLVRADSGIKSLGDLAGKTLVLGSKYSAEARILPVHYLKKQRIDLSAMKILDLDGKRDFRGNPCSSPQHVLEALYNGEADAGIVTQQTWQHAQNRKAKPDEPKLQVIWTTPEFNHCVFTAAADFDAQLGKRFTELMLMMDPNDPATSDIMRLEGTRQWIRGDQEGFRDLVEAIGKKGER